MEEYFQAFRIDHVLGFFRIWAIPASNYTGLLGRYLHMLVARIGGHLSHHPHEHCFANRFPLTKRRYEPCPKPITTSELKKLGVKNFDRLTKPFIRKWLIEEK